MKDITNRRRFLAGAMTVSGYAGLVSAGGPLAAAIRRAPSGSPSVRFLEHVQDGDLAAVVQALNVDPGLVHARDAEGRSAFALALLHRHGEVADLLRERGHRIDLHEAALAVDWETYEPMAEATPGLINQDHPIGGTAMYAAALGGAGGQIWRVFRYGGRPNDTPRRAGADTPLQAALQYPDLATAEMTAATLLSNGASPNPPDAPSTTALHHAARRGSLDLVEMLIRKGATLDARDERGRTSLRNAEQAGHEAVAELLRNASRVPQDHSSSRRTYDAGGAPYSPPNLGDLSLQTRLAIVGQAHSNLDEVRALLKRQPELAHAVATTTEGAVEAGAHMGRRDIVDLLLEYGAPLSLPTAVMSDNLDRVRTLLDEDPKRIHERGAHDFPLLWYPVIGKGLLEMAELLLARGALVEEQHWMGTTALHFAAVGGQTDMAKLFLEHGADSHRVGRKFDDKGCTAIDLAEARGHDDLARLLRGA